MPGPSTRLRSPAIVDAARLTTEPEYVCQNPDQYMKQLAAIDRCQSVMHSDFDQACLGVGGTDDHNQDGCFTVLGCNPLCVIIGGCRDDHGDEHRRCGGNLSGSELHAAPGKLPTESSAPSMAAALKMPARSRWPTVSCPTIGHSTAAGLTTDWRAHDHQHHRLRQLGHRRRWRDHQRRVAYHHEQHHRSWKLHKCRR